MLSVHITSLVILYILSAVLVLYLIIMVISSYYYGVGLHTSPLSLTIVLQHRGKNLGFLTEKRNILSSTVIFYKVFVVPISKVGRCWNIWKSESVHLHLKYSFIDVSWLIATITQPYLWLRPLNKLLVLSVTCITNNQL